MLQVSISSLNDEETFLPTYDRSAWTHWSAHWWAQKTKILLKNLHTWYLVMFHPLKIFHNFVLNFFGQNHQYWKGTKNIKLNTFYLVYLELVNCHILPIKTIFFHIEIKAFFLANIINIEKGGEILQQFFKIFH